MQHVFQLLDGDFDFVVLVEHGDVDGVARPAVERLALLQVLGDVGYQLVGTLALQQGALHLGHEQVLVERLGRGLEIDDIALAVQVVDVVEEARCAAAAADDDVFELGHLVQHVILYLAEALFAPLGKELRHRLVHAALDIPVQVVEHHTGLL